MLTTAKLLLRTAPTTLVRRFPAALVARGFSASPNPTDDGCYEKGHLKSDKLEFLDRQIEQTVNGMEKKGHLESDQLEFLDRQIEQTVHVMEENLTNLKKTYKSKRDHLETYTQLDPMMWPLLDQAFQQKEDLAQNIMDLKRQLQELRSTRSQYAVEAPDGESDGHILEEMIEVEHILEDIGKPKASPLFKEYAVESPDGEADAAILEEKAEVKHILQDIGNPKVENPPLGHEFAVDGPDGESDAQILCDELDANQQIDEISKTEDTAKINKIHATQTRIQQERARDPEHDW